MKNSQIIVALLVSMLSVSVVAKDEKEFGRKNVSILAGPATMHLMKAVASNVDAKFLKAETKFEYRNSVASLQLLCRGQGPGYPDMVAVTREMNDEEYKECQKNNVGSIIKVKIGYEAVVVVADKKSIDLDLNQRELYLALSKDVPNPENEGVVMDNFYKTWKDIDANAPKQAIKIFGPASKTRDARSVSALAMEGGCRTWDWIARLESLKASYRLYRAMCHVQRDDGHYIKAASTDTDLTKKLLANKNSIGLMSFNDWLKSKSKLKAYPIEELPPTLGTISKGLYPLSRGLYVYIKAENLHKVQGLAHVMSELLSKEALGEKGYLAEIGLVAMPAKELKREVQQAAQFQSMPKPEES